MEKTLKSGAGQAGSGRQSTRRTLMRLFRHRALKERLLRGRRLNILDFGCGKAEGTMGIFDALRSRRRVGELHIIGVDADCGERANWWIESNEKTFRMKVVESLPVFRKQDVRKLRGISGISKFDLITLLNPSPPEALMSAIIAGERQCAEAKRPRRVQSRRLEELRGSMLRYIRGTMGFRGKIDKDMGLPGLFDYAKELSLRIVVERVFPELLSKRGLVFIAAGEVVPLPRVRGILVEGGYKIRMDEENGEVDLLEGGGRGFSGYNRHLLAATLEENP